MVTYLELRDRAIKLDTDIRRKIQDTRSKEAQQAAEHAADAIAHQVVEWLLTAAKREGETK